MVPRGQDINPNREEMFRDFWGNPPASGRILGVCHDKIDTVLLSYIV
jgi:hypothetical protein